VGPSVGLDVVGKRKILHCRESNPGRPARSPNELSRLLKYMYFYYNFIILASGEMMQWRRNKAIEICDSNIYNGD
jgi:hypothetical protein